MSSPPLVRAAVRGLLSGLAAASCGGAPPAPAVVVPVEPVKAAPIATVPASSSRAAPILGTAPPPRARDYDCCKGKNACKGLSGCATSFNDCAGMNDCRGRGTSCPPGDDDRDP